jgi:FHA domain
MAICPNGHDSPSDDFCEVCGIRIASSSGASQSPGMPSAGSSAAMGMPGTSASADTGEPCPRCGTARSGQFCEACGYNFGAPQRSPSPASPSPQPPALWSSSSAQSPPSAQPLPSAPPVAAAPSVLPAQAEPGDPDTTAVWTAVVSSDRDYYERAQAAGGPDWADVTFPDYCSERWFRLTGHQMRIGRRSVSRGLEPEIDLTGPPADPGISRLHAVLICRPDGSWAVLDPGSANGTVVNGSEIPTDDQVPLHDGDRINLGAWTAITVHRG